MNVKNTLMAAGAVAVLGSGLALSGVASAHGNSDSMADKFAARFNLNKDEVQKVFDEERAAHRTEHQADAKQRLEARLQEAVDAGKLTAEQKAAIIAKHDELRASQPDLSGKTREERHELMEQKRDQLQQWAKDNNIPLEYLQMQQGQGGHGYGRGLGR